MNKEPQAKEKKERKAAVVRQERKNEKIAKLVRGKENHNRIVLRIRVINFALGENKRSYEKPGPAERDQGKRDKLDAGKRKEKETEGC